MTRPISILLLCGTLACAVKKGQTADTSKSDTSAVVAVRPDKIIFVKGDPAVHLVGPVDTIRLTVTPNALGPLRVGMSIAEVASIWGPGFAAPKGYDGGCGYATMAEAPPGLAVMLDSGKIARFEVRSGRLATAAGARIGDTESRIKSLYGKAVTTTPHKYVQGGHYLTVTPNARADSAYRIVFETDGSKVTEYRSGKVPEVEQAERCG